MPFRHTITLIVVLALSAPGHAQTALQDLVGDQTAACALLAKKCIVVTRAGHVEADFDRGADVLLRREALDLVQQEYARMLAADTKPEFVVKRTSGNSYGYTNKHGQKSTIEELHKALDDEGLFDVVFFVKGDRFFGSFQALIHLHAFPSKNGEIDYRLYVSAYPENMIVRFIARLAPVRRFFNRKADEISALSTRITESLCDRDDETLSQWANAK